MTEPMRLKARAAAPLAAVRTALTDAGALRTWLAEFAEVDLPDRYEFWGRYTPEGSVARQRPQHFDDHTVRFTWTIGDEDTTTEIVLSEESASSTILSLSQSHFPDWSEVMAGTNVRGLLSTFWALSIANLVDYVEGREVSPKCDYTTADLRASTMIAASPEAVYESLMDPAAFSKWFGAKVDIEPFVGGRFAMGGFESNTEPAKFVDLRPGRRVSMERSGLVETWELEGSDGGTRLTFVQSGFDQTTYGAWAGWLGGVAELRRYHEIPNWQPVWLEVEVDGLPAGMLTIGQ
jgi:uncharacterized protein YndB with AHSA1/START domain